MLTYANEPRAAGKRAIIEPEFSLNRALIEPEFSLNRALIELFLLLLALTCETWGREAGDHGATRAQQGFG
jgi:hypothetical protein